MKKNLVLFSMVMLTASIYGQSYTFSVDSSAYNELDNPIILTDPNEAWDDPDLTIPVDFPFELFGNQVNALYTVFGLGAEFYTTNDANGTTSPLLSPMFLDIMDRGYYETNSLSSISSKLSGTLGNRILKIQWKNVGLYDEMQPDEISTDFINFQVWLYETSNKIEMHYGESFISDNSLYTTFPVGLSDSIGLQTGEFGNIYYLSGTTSNPSLMITADENDFFDNGLTAFPAIGKIYIFNPFNPSAGLLDNSLADNIQIFPNPTKDVLTVKCDFKIEKIVLRDMLGREVFVQSTDFESFSLSALKSGNYIVEIQTIKGQINKKIMKI